jgi:hypothetical protein
MCLDLKILKKQGAQIMKKVIVIILVLLIVVMFTFT